MCFDENINGNRDVKFLEWDCYETYFIKLFQEFVKELRMRPLNRHYFVLQTNPGEQFYLFTSLAGWLIRKSGKDVWIYGQNTQIAKYIMGGLKYPYSFTDTQYFLDFLWNYFRMHMQMAWPNLIFLMSL